MSASRLTKSEVRKRLADTISKLQLIMFKGSSHITPAAYNKMSKMRNDLYNIRSRVK